MGRALQSGAARRELWQRGRAALAYTGNPAAAKRAGLVRVIEGAREWVGAMDGDQETAQDALDGFIEWGDEWLRALRGAFALAVWDGGRETLTIARDAAGEFMLYCARAASGLAFASNPESLMCLRESIKIGPVEALPQGALVRVSQAGIALFSLIPAP